MNDAPPSALLRTYADRLLRQADALRATALALEALAQDVDKTERMKVTVPPGWRVVPEVPTDAMCEALYDRQSPYSPNNAWRLMLAAAPKVTPSSSGS